MTLPAGCRRPEPEMEKTQPATNGLRLLWFYGMLAGFLMAVVFRFWPGGSPLWPVLPFAYACPVLSLTGMLCMGCGATRALRSLLAGNLATALRQNLLFVVLAAGGLWQCQSLAWQRLVPPGFAPRLPRFKLDRRLGWTLIVAGLAFMVMRNLDWPLAQLLRP